MTDTKHTDSVEARFNAKFNTHPYDKAQHIEYKAKEIIKFIKAEIKKANSQQAEGAVRHMAWCPQCGDALEQQGTQNDYSCFGCGDIHYKLTTNHQD